MTKLEQTLASTARMLCVEKSVDYWRADWFFHDKLHRDFDKPAIIRDNGDNHWYQYDKRHRDHDKPAIIFANGDKYWFQHSKLHRDFDKPAIICANGGKRWYQHDKRIKCPSLSKL